MVPSIALVHEDSRTVIVLSELLDTITHCKVTSLPSHTLLGPVALCLNAKEKYVQNLHKSLNSNIIIIVLVCVTYTYSIRVVQ